MATSSIFEEEINNYCNGPVLTTSNDQFIQCTRLSDQAGIGFNYSKNTPKLSTATLGSKTIQPRSTDATKIKIKNDRRVFKAKYVVYKTMQKNFINASDGLIKSHEAIRKFKTNLFPGNNDFELKGLQNLVLEIISDKFAIDFPKPKVVERRVHQSYMSNLKLPMSFDLTTPARRIDGVSSELNKLCNGLWKKLVNIAETNAKFNFWLQKIVDKDEFNDLDDVRDYLAQNSFAKEPKLGDMSAKLERFYDDVKYKLQRLLEELEYILESQFSSMAKENAAKKNDKNHTVEKIVVVDDVMEKKESSKESEVELTTENLELENETSKESKTELAEDKESTAMDDDLVKKIKILETKNEKLRLDILDCSKQLKITLAELSFQKSKLLSTKEQLTIMSKEKKDLINTISQMEVKEEGMYTLKIRLDKTRDENERLRSILKQTGEDEYTML